MFLSKVVLNTRCRDTYRIVADIYAQHRFVMSAFPDRLQTESQTEAAIPDLNVLYRMETMKSADEFERAEQIFLLVQSDLRPDWNKMRTYHLNTICSAEERLDGRTYQEGERYRFRLRANPTICRVNRDGDGNRNPKREGLFKEAEQLEWLGRAAERSGFSVNLNAVLITPGGKKDGLKPSPVSGNKSSHVTCYMVDFDGTLAVTDSGRFAETLRDGIGRGKAWGCGLLSIIRA